MHRITAPAENEEASYTDNLEASFNSMNMHDFWDTEYSFPGVSDGGLLGSSTDDLPSSMIKKQHDNEVKVQKNHYEHTPSKYNMEVKKIKKKRKKEYRGQLQRETTDIYRLGPSLENQWWRVDRSSAAAPAATKKKKRRRAGRKKERREAESGGIQSYSHSLPLIRPEFTLKLQHQS